LKLIIVYFNHFDALALSVGDGRGVRCALNLLHMTQTFAFNQQTQLQM